MPVPTGGGGSCSSSPKNMSISSHHHHAAAPDISPVDKSSRKRRLSLNHEAQRGNVSAMSVDPPTPKYPDISELQADLSRVTPQLPGMRVMSEMRVLPFIKPIT